MVLSNHNPQKYVYCYNCHDKCKGNNAINQCFTPVGTT